MDQVTAAAAERARATAWIEGLHEEITAFFERVDGGGRFREDRWTRPGGGGGVSRVLTDGVLLEKAGVSRSAVHGTLPADTIARIGARVPWGDAPFFVTGVSVVVHPRNPRIPTVHLNVRYFQFTDRDDAIVDRWVAGGTDLTPTSPSVEDAVHFHCVLKAACDRYHAGLYPRFKAWCDDYFVNHHRGGEARGVGGVFFDHLRDGDPSGLGFDDLWAFTDAIGRVLPEAWGPIATRHRGAITTERERRLQLLRRGRYVEFNLLHDRGTLFGLRTEARVESVLMSLPPMAAWEYAVEFAPGSAEAELAEMLRPRDWASGGAVSLSLGRAASTAHEVDSPGYGQNGGEELDGR